jgi:CheY-like chemotaxis protein
MATRILVVDDSPTIGRVVSMILEKHGYDVTLAYDGQDAMEVLASGQIKADLVLLDYVMPRMNGYEFCSELRAHPELATTPVVLMSAKADRIRDQFLERCDAIGAITKPFDAQTIVAVIENALRHVAMLRANHTQHRGSTPASSDLPTSNVRPTTDGDFETRRTNISQIVATKIAHVVSTILTDMPGITPAELAANLASHLEQDAIVEILKVMRDFERSDEAGPLLSGEIGAIPIGAVLQLLQVENQSGVFTCRGPNITVSATFHNGLVEGVQATGAGDDLYLGRFFVEEGIVSPNDIEQIVTGPSPIGRINPETSDHRLLGTALLERKKITEAQLHAALNRQASEMLYEVLRWSKGHFDFRPMPKTASANTDANTTDRGTDTADKSDDNGHLALPVSPIVTEGLRRALQWRILDRVLGSLDTVLVRDDVALGLVDESSLPAKERAVLAAVDGKRTVRAIVRTSHMSSFDTCRILAQLIEARVLRQKTD